MKRVSWLLIAVFFLITSVSSQVNWYTDAWKTIDEAVEQDLPETALKNLRELNQQALKDINLSQQVKIQLYQLRIKAEKDPSQVGSLLVDAEKSASLLPSSPEKQLMYLMIAEAYHQYLSANQFQLSKRTSLQSRPENNTLALEEWTEDDFRIKLNELIVRALNDTLSLQQRKIQAEDVLLISDSLTMQAATTWYDLVLQKLQDMHLLDQYKKDETYWLQRQLAFRKTQAEIFPLVMAEIRWRNRIFQSDNQPGARQRYILQLDSLHTIYNAYPEVVEIISELASAYLSQEEGKGGKRIAFRMCEEGIRRFPDYPRIHLLKNTQIFLQNPSIQLSTSSYFPSSEPIRTTITTTNVKRMKVELHRLNTSMQEYRKQHRRPLSWQRNQPFPNTSVVDSQWVDIRQNPELEPVTDTLQFPSPGYGLYEIRVLIDHAYQEENPMPFNICMVTDLTAIRKQTKKTEELNYTREGSTGKPVEELISTHESSTGKPVEELIYTLDRSTGKPVQEVKIELFRDEWKNGEMELIKENELLSGKEGLARHPGGKNLPTLMLSKGKDAWCYLDIYSIYYDQALSAGLQTRFGIFTDRSIYRPGQVVYYKTIAFKSGNGIEQVVADTTLEVTLKQRWNKEISKQKVKTNEMGSANGSFVLPENLTNGNYTLQVGNDEVNIQVEAYKRPTFEVNIASETDEVVFGKPVQLEGRAQTLAGFPLQQARVNYRIKRRTMPFFRYFSWYRQDEQTVVSGEVSTNEEGKFSLSFTPEKETNTAGTNYYNFVVEADVTSLNGETQQGQLVVQAGERSFWIRTEMDAVWEKNKALSLGVEVRNLNDSLLVRTVNYELFQLLEDGMYKEDRTQNRRNRKLLLSGQVMSSDSLRLRLSTYRSGSYLLKFSALDSKNDTVSVENEFVLFSANDPRPAVNTYLWNPTPKLVAQPGSKLTLTIGSSAKNAWILYELTQGITTLKREWLKVNVSNRRIKLQLSYPMHEDVVATYTMVRNGKIYTTQTRIQPVKEDKKLKPQLMTFRDKLQPGSKEEWTVGLVGYKGQPAELLAAMYDASLDKLRRHSWQFYPNQRPALTQQWPWFTNYQNSTSAVWSKLPDYLNIKEYTYATLNFFGSPEALSGSGHFRDRRAQPMMIRGGSPMKAMAPDVVEILNVVEDDVEIISTTANQPENSEIPVKVRENFAETAFFLPHLRTDSTGHFKLHFTMPESLTRWKLKLLAHTADLYSGESEYTLETQKDLMVQLNLPRFVRQSDKWEARATVMNKTQETRKVVLQFSLKSQNTLQSAEHRLSDNVQESGTPVFASKTIELAPGSSQAVSWEVPELYHYDLMIARVAARSGAYTDGEQHYLPVLSDKQLITESVAFTVQEGERKEISFSTPLEPTSIRRQVVEFTTNPVWTAVQALPLLSVPETENAIDWLGAWYASATARSLIRQHPELVKTLKSIQIQGRSNESLISQLEKNQDLKLMLIQSTPWLSEANDETEQQRQLLRLFDEQQQLINEEAMLQKLSNLQLPSGAFSWMSGMPANRYITQLITDKMQRMYNHPEYDRKQSLRRMIVKAYSYLDSQLANDLAQLKAYDKKYTARKTITPLQLQYLTLRALWSEIPESKAAQEAITYYSNQTSSYRHSFGLYEKAMAAQFFHRTGNSAYAAELFKSLREQALIHPEKGMYWATKRSSWQWNERPLSIHVRLLEAFQEAGGTAEEVNRIKLWLLNQKRTNQWDNRLITLEAVSALLNSGSDWLAGENKYRFTIERDSVLPSNMPSNQSTSASHASSILHKKELIPLTILPGSGYFRMDVPSDATMLIVESLTRRPDSTAGTRRAALSSGASTFTPDNQSKAPSSGTSASTPYNQSTATGTSSPAWGALFRQSLQDMDKVQESGNELKVERSYFQSQTIGNITSLVPLTHNTKLVAGDKLISRIIIRSERDFEFVVLRDTKAATVEIANQLSGIQFRDRLVYYRSPGDFTTNYYIDRLPKGTYILEEEYFVTHAGDFSAGTAQIQCMYAAEYNSTSKGTRIKSGVTSTLPPVHPMTTEQQHR